MVVKMIGDGFAEVFGEVLGENVRRKFSFREQNLGVSVFFLFCFFLNFFLFYFMHIYVYKIT